MYAESRSEVASSTCTDASTEDVALIGTTVGVRSLARNVSGVIKDVVSSQRLVVVTKHGVPIAAIVPIDCLDGRHWPGRPGG